MIKFDVTKNKQWNIICVLNYYLVYNLRIKICKKSKQ